MTKQVWNVLTALAVAGVSGDAIAQSSYDPVEYDSITAHRRFGREFRAEVEIGSGLMNWGEYLDDGGSAVSLATVPTMMSHVAGVRSYGPLTLVSHGYDQPSDAGKIVSHFILPTAPHLQFLDETTLPGRDITQLVFDGAELAVFDRQNSEVLIAAYDPLSLLPDEAAFAVAVDATVLASLGDGPVLLHPMSDAVFGGEGFALTFDPGWGLTSFNVWNDAGTWSVRPFPVMSSPEAWQVESYPATNRPLRIHGAAGPFQIVDTRDDSVVFNGTQTSTAPQKHTPTTLEPGVRYRLESASGAAPTTFTPNVRYGEGIGLNGIEMRNGFPNSDFVIGEPSVFLGGAIRQSDPAVGAATGLVWLWLAQRRADGTDPVVDVDGSPVLTELMGTAGPIMVEPSPGGDYFGFELPLPNDPNLAGTVFLWQFVSLTGMDLLVSDVVGAKTVTSN